MNATTTSQDTTAAYSYPEQVEAAIRDWLEANRNAYHDADDMHDQCQLDVTGAAVWSYTCNRWQAIEYIIQSGFLFGDDWNDFIEWLVQYDNDIPAVMSDPEALDMMIRLFLFDEIWNAVINEDEEEECGNRPRFVQGIDPWANDPWAK